MIHYPNFKLGDQIILRLDQPGEVLKVINIINGGESYVIKWLYGEYESNVKYIDTFYRLATEAEILLYGNA